eukprot:SAG11_NODE_28634_length_319_cov_1.168182_1_plen_35_part_01
MVPYLIRYLGIVPYYVVRNSIYLTGAMYRYVQVGN